MRKLALAALLVAFGCDPAPMDDAGMDAAPMTDARPRSDAPPAVCTPGCDVGQTCCGESGGAGTCLQLRSDPRHCGGCNVDCISTHRGDDCRTSQCACGVDRLGCLGTSESFCCEPRPGTSVRYCANLEQDSTNCGGCDARCDVRRSDRCDGGNCVCGATRETCDGTPSSVCCRDGADIGCVDTTTDRIHCGDCNVLCIGAERCEGGTCTRGEACEGGCELGQVCCAGSCCARNRCQDGVCSGGGSDAGISDAGPGDAGTSDGGTSDGGPSDGGVDASVAADASVPADGGVDASAADAG